MLRQLERRVELTEQRRAVVRLRKIDGQVAQVRVRSLRLDAFSGSGKRFDAAFVELGEIGGSHGDSLNDAAKRLVVIVGIEARVGCARRAAADDATGPAG